MAKKRITPKRSWIDGIREAVRAAGFKGKALEQELEARWRAHRRAVGAMAISRSRTSIRKVPSEPTTRQTRSKGERKRDHTKETREADRDDHAHSVQAKDKTTDIVGNLSSQDASRRSLGTVQEHANNEIKLEDIHRQTYDDQTQTSHTDRQSTFEPLAVHDDTQHKPNLPNVEPELLLTTVNDASQLAEGKPSGSSIAQHHASSAPEDQLVMQSEHEWTDSTTGPALNDFLETLRFHKEAAATGTPLDKSLTIPRSAEDAATSSPNDDFLNTPHPQEAAVMSSIKNDVLDIPRPPAGTGPEGSDTKPSHATPDIPGASPYECSASNKMEFTTVESPQIERALPDTSIHAEDYEPPSAGQPMYAPEHLKSQPSDLSSAHKTVEFTNGTILPNDSFGRQEDDTGYDSLFEDEATGPAQPPPYSSVLLPGLSIYQSSQGPDTTVDDPTAGGTTTTGRGEDPSLQTFSSS